MKSLEIGSSNLRKISLETLSLGLQANCPQPGSYNLQRSISSSNFFFVACFFWSKLAELAKLFKAPRHQKWSSILSEARPDLVFEFL
jgi:hypothetical protein